MHIRKIASRRSWNLFEIGSHVLLRLVLKTTGSIELNKSML